MVATLFVLQVSLLVILYLLVPLSPKSDAGEAELCIQDVSIEDDGMYTCTAANDLGTVSTSASLRVLGERHYPAKTPRMPHCLPVNVSGNACFVKNSGTSIIQTE